MAKISAAIRAQTELALADPYIQQVYWGRGRYVGEGPTDQSPGPPAPPFFPADATYIGGPPHTPGARGYGGIRYVRFIRRRIVEKVPFYLFTPRTPQTLHGPMRAARNTLAFTVRREYGQYGSRFSGMHTMVRRGVAMSQGGMLPPRQNRLAPRAIPRSYGSATQEIG